MFNIYKSLFIYLFCLYSIYCTKENYKSVNNLHSNNNCSRCKILSDSFNYWFVKTARGKHEGGDAAWEETKLKNYAFSEMRLVEIQESLCSELKLKKQDHCYTVAGEVENAIELWWSLGNSNAVNLYSWLCIENLKYCCPTNHYGVECTPCLTNNDTKVCSNHGRCDGDGTRIGNGSCICDNGYVGDVCDKCGPNHYIKNSDLCEPCHESCNGCHNSGPSACLNCATGWILKSGECLDINECEQMFICKVNEFCVNKNGSYTCKACHKTCETCSGSGKNSCSTCYGNDLLWSGRCIDEDEQHQIFYYMFLRYITCMLVLAICFVIFQNSKFLISVFVISTSVCFFYLETYYENGILFPFR